MRHGPGSSVLYATGSVPPPPRGQGGPGARRAIGGVGRFLQGEARLLLATLSRLLLGTAARGVVPRPPRARRVSRVARGPTPSPPPPASDLQDEEAALQKALSHPDPTVRARSLDVVSTFSAARAERYVSLLIWDPDPNVRSAAATACARLATPRTLSSLILTLDDPNEVVRHAAAAALRIATGKDLPESVTHNEAERESVVRDLRGWWKEERYSDLRQQQGRIRRD